MMNNLFRQVFEKTAKLKKSVELRDHQKRVEEKLEKNPALLVYHGLGNGKTLSAINVIGDEETDFVVPASLRENARKELEKFTTSNKADVRSYQNFTKDGPKGKYLVLDEAHRIGNVATKTSKTVRDAASAYEKRILLTGSPVRNHPSELGALAAVLDPESSVIPTTDRAFKSRFIKKERHKPSIYGRVIKGERTTEEYGIKNKTKFRKFFEDKVDYQAGGDDHFPKVTEENVDVVMNEAQEKLYKETFKSAPSNIRYKIRNDIPLSKSERVYANAFLNKARQISNTVRPFGEEEVSPKIEQMRDDIISTLLENPRAKTVSYSSYLDSGVRELSKELTDAGIDNAIFDGSLNDKARKEIISNYNRGKIKSLLLSGAGSEGLDLKDTRMIQIMEPHWNEARTDQVKGRTIRYKSHESLPEDEQHVLVKNYISKLSPSFFGKTDVSTDEYITNRGKEKSELNNLFLNYLKELGSPS